MLGRCLALQLSGTPGADETGISDNLIGPLIGAVPRISKAACRALDALLALAGAVAAAHADGAPLRRSGPDLR